MAMQHPLSPREEDIRDGTPMDVEAYLALDAGSEFKWEYIGGRVYRKPRQDETSTLVVNGRPVMMAGTTRLHMIIKENFSGQFYNQLRGKPCETYTESMRTQAGLSEDYYYPDVIVVCGEREFSDDKPPVLVNPTLTIEILSKSSESFDRGEKAFRYRELGSLRAYLIVWQDQMKVEVYRREGASWISTEYTHVDDVIELPAIGARLVLADIYERLTFDNPTRDAER